MGRPAYLPIHSAKSELSRDNRDILVAETLIYDLAPLVGHCGENSEVVWSSLGQGEMNILQCKLERKLG